jgi:hypothetical protein
MNKFLLFLGILLLGFFSTNTFAQENSVTNSSDEVYTALKPADAKPMIFYSQEELELAVPEKIESCKLAISENLNTPERVQYNREQIWRLENAIVKTDSSNSSSSYNTVSTVEENNSISIRPEDGTPVSFFTQEELEKTVPVKIEKLKSDISSGNYSGDKLQNLKEQLWRFENAIVTERK